MNCPACQAENAEGSEICFACGKGIHALTQGAILAGRYQIQKALGTGGMGIVYLAHDQALDELVAVKVLRPQLASSADMTSRFRSEIKLARKVGHPNVCRIYEYGVDGLRHFISMEYVDGVDLRRLVQQRKGLPTDEAFDVAVQVSRGLQAIHDAGIIHRDLKGSNIMIDGAGTARLMDFGIAKQLGGERTAGATNMVLGTPEYMSPEQALGAPLDFRSDVYSLAVVIYEIFTGRVPFEGHTPVVTMFMHVKEPPPLEGKLAERLPAALLPLLRKALSKDPSHRFATARGLAAELRKARGAGRAVAPGAAPAGAEGATPVTAGVPEVLTDRHHPAGAPAVVAEPRGVAAAGLTERIDAWVQALNDPEAHVRWGAAVALWEVGPAAAAAAPALSAALADADPTVAKAAEEALKRLTGDKAEAHPASANDQAKDGSPPQALLSALEQGDVKAREEAVLALGSLRPPAATVPPLVRALKDGEPAVRAAAAASLVQVGAALSSAGGADSSADRPAIERLVEALGEALGEALEDQSVAVRRRAARGLGELGPRAQLAVPRLIKALQDPQASVADAAASALEAMVGIRRATSPKTDAPSTEPSVSPPVSTLITGLKHGDPSVRWRAALALGESGVAARAAVPDLVELLDDETEIIRWEAAKALGKLGEAAAGAVPALAATLHGRKDAIVRRSAAEALGRIGPSAGEGVPALIAALKDLDAAVADASEEALLRIGRGAVPALVEAVKDDDATVRLKAVEIVMRMGTDWSAQHAVTPAVAPEPSSPWEGKRRSRRLDVGVTLRLRRLQPRGKEASEELTVTENLSEGGAKLITSLPIEKGEIVELQERTGPLRIQALVLNVSIGSDNRPRLHLQFFEVDGAARLKDLLGETDAPLDGPLAERPKPPEPQSAT